MYEYHNVYLSLSLSFSLSLSLSRSFPVAAYDDSQKGVSKPLDLPVQAPRNRGPLTRFQAQSLPPSVPNPISLQSDLLSEPSLVEPDGSVMIEQPVSLPEDIFLSKSTSPDECQLITHCAEGEHQVLVHSDARQYANNDYTDLRRLPKLLFPPANSKEWLKIDNELRDELRQILCGIQCYLREEAIDFFSDREFFFLKNVLDSEMKQLLSQGVGTKKKQAEPILASDEELYFVYYCIQLSCI